MRTEALPVALDAILLERLPLADDPHAPQCRITCATSGESRLDPNRVNEIAEAPPGVVVGTSAMR